MAGNQMCPVPDNWVKILDSPDYQSTPGEIVCPEIEPKTCPQIAFYSKWITPFDRLTKALLLGNLLQPDQETAAVSNRRQSRTDGKIKYVYTISRQNRLKLINQGGYLNFLGDVVELHDETPFRFCTKCGSLDHRTSTCSLVHAVCLDCKMASHPGKCLHELKCSNCESNHSTYTPRLCPSIISLVNLYARKASYPLDYVILPPLEVHAFQ